MCEKAIFTILQSKSDRFYGAARGAKAQLAGFDKVSCKYQHDRHSAYYGIPPIKKKKPYCIIFSVKCNLIA